VTTFYHPTANGKLGRRHQTLAAIISHFTSKASSKWESFLHTALFALRSSRNAATRESPHFLVYGRDPRFLFETLTEPQRIYYSIDTDYKEELILKMKQAFEVARTNAKKAALLSAKQYNKTAKAVTKWEIRST